MSSSPRHKQKRRQYRDSSRVSTCRTSCYAPSVVNDLCNVIDSDLSKHVRTLLAERRYKELVSLEIDPSSYTSAESFRGDYLLCEVLSKYPNWDIGVDRSLVAIAKFIDSEVTCAKTNLELADRVRNTKINGIPVSAVFLTASHKITRLLGTFDLNECEESMEWGPGASVSLPRRSSDAYYKFGTKPTASTNMAVLATAIQQWYTDGSWKFHPVLVPGSHGTTVPKNAKTDRFIAIEPDLNLFVQKGIGRMIRKRLQRIGLLTPDAQHVNAELARRGSIDESLATLDLSGASDSIASVLVRELLPQGWVYWLELARSPTCTLPSLGVSTYLEKISSMGNGYTFELETLLFWALSQAMSDLLGENGHRCVVYGDDIVVPTGAAAAVIDLLQVCGFTINQRKSFTKGPFRESCGKHWFNGVDVTPFYVRETVLTQDRIYWLANSIREWASDGSICDGRLKNIYDRVVSLLPDARILPVPRLSGKATGLILDAEEAIRYNTVRFCKRRWAYTYRFLSSKTSLKDPQDDQRLAKSLYLLRKKWGGSESDKQVSERRQIRPLRPGNSWLIGRVPRGFINRVAIGITSGWDGYGSWA